MTYWYRNSFTAHCSSYTICLDDNLLSTVPCLQPPNWLQASSYVCTALTHAECFDCFPSTRWPHRCSAEPELNSFVSWYCAGTVILLIALEWAWSALYWVFSPETVDSVYNGHLKIHFYLDGILFFFVTTTQQRNQAPRPFLPFVPHHLLTWSSSMSCSCCPACLSLSPRSIILPYNSFHFFWSSDIFSWIETAA